MGETDYLMVIISFADGVEAEKAARVLVEERLAACVHILPGVTAIYRWQGQIETDPQTVLLAKTTGSLWTKLRDQVQSLHSDQVPEIICLPVVAGLPAYLSWMKDVLHS